MQLRVAAVKAVPGQPHTRRGYKPKTRVYVWPVGESLIDNLINRRSRPISAFRAVAETALTDLGVDMDKITMRWSQKAGCSCGCSPGFIVDGWDMNIDGKDVHVDAEMV